MQTQSIAPETIISGFAHFLWLAMFSLLCAEVDIPSMIDWLSKVSVGAIALLLPILFGASHFLGTLANRIGSDIISIRNSEPDLKNRYKGREKYKEAAIACDLSWRTKAFFLSMAFAIAMTTIMTVWLDCRSRSGKDWALILAIGIIICVLSIIAVITQNKDFRRLQDFIDQKMA